MSLRDTIDGARREAKEAGGLGGSVKPAPAPKAEKPERGARAEKSGRGEAEKRDPMTARTYRSSAAGAKPSREAASTVRTASPGSSAGLGGGLFGGGGTPAQKEARKEEKRKQREKEDFRQRGYNLILRSDDEYRRTDRTWWLLTGFGFGMTVVSLILVWAFPADSTNYQTIVGIASVVSLVLAYGLIIGAFVYDWRVRRPVRKAAERKVASYSDKKLAELFEEQRRRENAADAAHQAEKEAAKDRRANKKK
ncbi:MAG: hypothetical protein MR874_00900 [Coriobacteriaceae bacterium]|uniref:hypothetical protein n=1 Tax=Tractidigestivibacter sp. TaxID=2847320 RepID=UPI002A82359D|nr:hypothetical protein [Tractidigestivibacter sp.]MCI6843305.1 hypothetical protein [Coriobacteriaceae bacterium]MDY4535548.1 hypothetical protein [Tractidigestivibacter sp.]